MAERQGATLGQWAEFQRLQALEDAIAYRTARLAAPCLDCEHLPAARRCEEHARDLELVDEYQAVATAASASLARSLAACQGEPANRQRTALTGRA